MALFLSGCPGFLVLPRHVAESGEQNHSQNADKGHILTTPHHNFFTSCETRIYTPGAWLWEQKGTGMQ